MTKKIEKKPTSKKKTTAQKSDKKVTVKVKKAKKATKQLKKEDEEYLKEIKLLEDHLLTLKAKKASKKKETPVKGFTLDDFPPVEEVIKIEDLFKIGSFSRLKESLSDVERYQIRLLRSAKVKIPFTEEGAVNIYAVRDLMSSFHCHMNPEEDGWDQALVNMAFKDGTIFKLSFQNIINLLKTGDEIKFNVEQKDLWKFMSMAIRNEILMNMSLNDVKVIIKAFKKTPNFFKTSKVPKAIMRFRARRANLIQGLKAVLTLGAISCHCDSHDD